MKDIPFNVVYGFSLGEIDDFIDIADLVRRCIVAKHIAEYIKYLHNN